MDNLNSKRSPGRPSKFDERLGEKIVELFEKGKTVREVCDLVGIHPKTLRIWMSKNAPLRASIKEAKFSADDLVETSLFHMAIDGNVTAAIFWLKNRQPDRWRDKNETSHTHTVVNRLHKMPDDQLAKEKQKYDEIVQRFEQRQLEGQIVDVTPRADTGDPERD